MAYSEDLSKFWLNFAHNPREVGSQYLDKRCATIYVSLILEPPRNPIIPILKSSILLDLYELLLDK